MDKREELIAERERLYQEHLKQHDEIAKKSFEWSLKNHKGGLDGYDPYDEKMCELYIDFIKKIDAEIEAAND